MDLPPGSNLPDENHGPAILASCATVTVLALTAVVTRMWVRVIMIRSVGWDDYFIIAAMVGPALALITKKNLTIDSFCHS